MIYSGNLKGHSKQRSLMSILLKMILENSPEFPYPVEPDCKSVLEP